ncbi:hypothetical protein BpHYR1_026615 [Brachionus plicatilis]|uniref:Uncharacterized protein n=1 Tax=Brachionus plicatilis TaxID=10195 RepID=A0A3M7T904_BRAPC|nr:hypothetical protein BpHYR1_026615 [Brachionus plicatilis]
MRFIPYIHYSIAKEIVSLFTILHQFYLNLFIFLQNGLIDSGFFPPPLRRTLCVVFFNLSIEALVAEYCESAKCSGSLSATSMYSHFSLLMRLKKKALNK